MEPMTRRHRGRDRDAGTIPRQPIPRTIWTLALLGTLGATAGAAAQSVHSVDVRGARQDVVRGHLDLGGRNPEGDSIGFTSYFMEVNGTPTIPVIGEFHYSRYPERYWNDELRKMKAGGVTVVATYVFWNIHEANEGEFDWEGDLNLRQFVQLAGANDLDVIVRIGPFDHGEIRNGGLPDWLYGRPLSVRSNHPDYLGYVDRLYRQIGHQIRGLYYREGGPIIGIQLENEYQHSSAPWAFAYPGQTPLRTASARDAGILLDGVGIQLSENPFAREGQDHMTVLKELAMKHGMHVPLYTATGWGNAAIVPRGSIPVTAGYAYPTWAPREPSPFYLYRDIHEAPDYSPVSYEAELYPSFPAELGGGIQITYSRRPTVPARSLEALIVRVLGSGANGVGYYMFHGGATPLGFSDEAVGVPKINYDFQAPIGQYGQLRPSFHRLKLLHFFLQDYGARLAPLPVVLPAGASEIEPSDTRTLRFAARSDGEAGFIFLHNFQDHAELHDLEGLQLGVRTELGEIRIPHASTFTLRKGVAAILPFGLDVEGVRLVYATAQPLAILRGGTNPRHTFTALEGVAPEFAFDTSSLDAARGGDCEVRSEAGTTYVGCAADQISTFQVEKDGRVTEFAVFPKSLALQAWRLHTGAEERLVFSEASVIPRDGLIEVHGVGSNVAALSTYPRLARVPRLRAGEIRATTPPHPSLSAFAVEVPAPPLDVRVQRVGEDRLTLEVDSVGLDGPLNDVRVEIDYTGDTGMAFIDGRLVDDHFYHGAPWTIGLKRFMPELEREGMYFFFRSMPPDAPFLADLPQEAVPDFGDRRAVLEIDGVEVVPEYEALLAF